MLKAGILLQNRYEIMNRIGSGGMADVYKARDHKLNRFVAVKVLKQEFKDDKAFVSKFRVEAQAAAGLAHANIVNVYDVGEDRGVSFIVMELVEGITLKSYIAKKGRLSVREATSIALQVAAGLESAHNNGIIHRDVKPQNIIISLDGKAKIADFGIARAASSDTITSSAMGSVHYCAPEQTRGGYSDAKSDIYSMGITMYEMLTGRVPFDGDTTVEVALKHLQEEIPNPAQYVTEIPYAMQQIVLKCMQKSPDRRYANMGELIRDLRESLVNPDGNFVTIPKLDRKAQTVLFSRDELTRIKNSSMPAYDKGQNTGAAGVLANERGSVSGDERMYPYGGSYYQSSGYQDLRHNQPQEGAPQGDRYMGTVADDYDSYDLPDEDFDDYEDEKERRRRKRSRDTEKRGGERIVTILGIVAAVIVGLLVLFFAGRAIGVIGRNSRQTEAGSQAAGQDEQTGRYVTVPDLLGRSEEEARKLLREQELGYKYQGERASADYQKGTICEQTVAAGTSVEKNTTIGCILSTGASTALAVPALAGATQDAAKQTLESMGLAVSFDNTRYSNEVEQGAVITTNPGAGSSVKAGDVVTVFISQGPDTSKVKVPQMVGHYVEDAKTELRNLNLYCYITEEYSDTVEKDFVIAQDIEEGSMVDTGTAVTITVSTGRSGTGEDITVLDGSDTTGKWICRVQLQAPPDYTGEAMLVRINLVQGDVTSTVFEGETTFPYILKAEGQPGIATGTVYLYTLDPYTWEVTSTIMYDGLNFYEEEE